MRLKHLLPIAIPLTCIAISIAMSPWFSFWKNALSDLGHVKRATAPIFNLGLVTGGLLIALRSRLVRLRSTSLSLLATSYFLILVGTFDEAYGKLHYWVSVLFFLGLVITGYVMSLETGKRYPAALSTLSILVWAIHFSGVGWGTAVPESIAIALALPWYLELDDYTAEG